MDTQQQLVDRFAITDTLTRYTRAIDTGEWDILDTVFLPDAEINYVESGGIEATYDVIKPWLAENLPIFPERMHMLGQLSVEFGESTPDLPDEAQVAAYFHNPMMLGKSVVQIGGIYHHTMVRTPLGWRSRKLHEQVVWKLGI